MYYSLNCAFFFYFCYLVSVSLTVHSLVCHACIFFNLVPFKGTEDSVTNLDDDAFGAVCRILLFLWAPSSFAIHVSKLCVVLFFYRKHLVLCDSVPSPIFLFFLYPLRMY